MKKLVIILAIAIMLFAIPEQRAEQPPRATTGASQNAAAEQTEKVPETNAEQVEKTTDAIYEPMQTKSKGVTKKDTAVQTPMKECAEETERQQATEPEETVECVDRGDQALAEYKPQPGGLPNPFENAPPADIVDHPVDELISEGEDRPGEGKHF